MICNDIIYSNMDIAFGFKDKSLKSILSSFNSINF